MLNRRLLLISKSINENLQLPNIFYVCFSFDEDKYVTKELNGAYPIVAYFDAGLARDNYNIESLSKFSLKCLKDENAMQATLDYFEQLYEDDNVTVVRSWKSAVRLAHENTQALHYKRDENRWDENWRLKA